MDSYLPGVDIGTQGVKCSLYDQSGVSRGSVFVLLNPIQPEPGIMEEDSDFQVKPLCVFVVFPGIRSLSIIRNLVGMKRGKLPKIVCPTKIVGEMTYEMAGKCGLL